MTEETPQFDPVIVAVFHSQVEGELAQSRLAAEGITSEVNSEDAGGMFPNFNDILGVAVLVAKADAAKARMILGAKAAE